MGTAHYIALNDFGGLQTLFISTVQRRDGLRSDYIVLNRAAEPPLDRLTDSLQRTNVPVYWVANRRRAFTPFDSFNRVWRWFRGEPSQVELEDCLVRHRIGTILCWNTFPQKEMITKERRALFYDHGKSWIANPTTRSRETVARASGYIAVSQAAQAMLRHVWDIADPIAVVPNPLRFDSDILPPLRLRSAPDEPVVIGAAGRMLSFKGFASLVEAIAILAMRGWEVQLKLAGTGPEEQALKEQCARLGLTQVEFCGLVDDMPSFYEQIDLLICPSLREPFGLVSLEALAFGVPTIVSRVDGLPETFPQPWAGLAVQPTLPLDRYASLGSSLDRMPALVYDPATETVGPPLALDPEALVDAMEKVLDNYSTYAANAFAAGKAIRQTRGMTEYVAELDRAIHA